MANQNSIRQVSQDNFLFLLDLCREGDDGQPLWNRCPMEDVERAKTLLGLSQDTRTKCIGVRRGKLLYCANDSTFIEIAPDRKVMTVYSHFHEIESYLRSADTVNPGDFTDIINGCGLVPSQIIFGGSNGLYAARDVCDISGVEVTVDLRTWNANDRSCCFIVNG